MKESIFISYSAHDSEFADSLVKALMDEGLAVFYDKQDIRWGDRFINHTQEMLASASSIIVILSRNYINSRWTQFERGAAFAQGKRILPILIGEDDIIPSDLRSIAFINAKELDVKTIAKRISELIENE